MMRKQSVGELMIKLAAIFFVLCSMFSACSMLNNRVGLDDDHAMEEFLEEQINIQLAIDIDLTPESEEK